MRISALIAASATGVACGWNLTSVGAVADPLAGQYDKSLASVGLLGAALWLSHALVQAPAGRSIDSIGARAAARVALAGIIVLNLLAALIPVFEVTVALRLVTGVFVGTAMVSAAVRASPRGTTGQGWIGGAASAGAALAIAGGPRLEDAIGWRAPYLGAAVLAVLLLPLAGSGPETERRARNRAADGHSSGRLLLTTALLRPGLALGTCIVVSFALGNWITVLLRETGEFGAVGAGSAGALVVAGGAITRPLGGRLAERNASLARFIVAGSLLTCVLACAAIVAVPERPVLLGAMAVLGLAAGLPFGAIVQIAPALVPDRPGAAIGLVGTLGTLCGVIAIPLLGLSTGSGSSARICFGALGLLALAALVVGRSPAPDPSPRPREAYDAAT